MFYALWPYIHLVGRLLFSLVFVAEGVSALTRHADDGAGPSASGTRRSTALLGIAFIVGGLTVTLGWHRFIGAGLLFGATIVWAVTLHAFWKESDPRARAAQTNLFVKDLGLAGAALLVAYYAGFFWPMSLGG